MAMLRLVTAAQAASVDAALLASPGFTLDVLVEVAGIACAEAIAAVYPPSSHRRALVLVGPGNNGLDGLVAARWMRAYGFEPTVVSPRAMGGTGDGARVYANLLQQLQWSQVPVSRVLPGAAGDVAAHADVIIDAVFGFSFKRGTGVRAPYDALLDYMRDAAELEAARMAARDSMPSSGPTLARSVARGSGVPVVSIDVPSGWDVDDAPTCASGDVLSAPSLRPSMLISLTAPKPCSARFDGPHHWLGGRFVPPAVLAAHGITLPPFTGASHAVSIGRPRRGCGAGTEA